MRGENRRRTLRRYVPEIDFGYIVYGGKRVRVIAAVGRLTPRSFGLVEQYSRLRLWPV